MKRKIISLLCVLLLLITAFPLSAYADEAEGFKLYVGGVEVTRENAKDVFGDGTVSYEKTSNTLTLKGASIKGVLEPDGAYYAIRYDGSSRLTLRTLKNSSIIINGEDESSELCGIICSGALTVTGGELYIKCEKSKIAYGIVCNDALMFIKAEVEINCAAATQTGVGAYCENALGFDDSEIKLFGSSKAFYTNGSLNIISGSYFMGSNPPTDEYPMGYEYMATVKADSSGSDVPSTTPKKDSSSKNKQTDKKEKTVDDNELLIANTDTDAGDVYGSSFLPLMPVATGKNRKIILKWKKYNVADGYIIYGSRCGKKMKRLKTVKSAKKTKLTFKKLKKGKYYKYIVVAYKNKNGKRRVLSTSKSVHCTTSGGKRGNPTGIRLKATELTLKKGKKKKLKPKLISKKRVARHIAKFRYESTDTATASVSSRGKIKARKKGAAYIYVIAQNGKYKKVKITVK